MAKLPTIQEMAKDVADTALKEMCVNGLPLGEFIFVRVGKIADMALYEYNHTKDSVMKNFCLEILDRLNISLDEVENGKSENQN
jgi:hypothetical protein